MALIDFSMQDCHKPLICKKQKQKNTVSMKHNKAKCNQMRYTCINYLLYNKSPKTNQFKIAINVCYFI